MTKQECAIKYIEDNYLQFNRLRHDIIADKLQVRCAHNLGEEAKGDEASRQEQWREMTKHDINSIVCHAAQEYDANITSREVMTALQSDLIPDVHPLREYVLSCREWTEEQPDWIDFVASQVRVADNASSGGQEFLSRLKARTIIRKRMFRGSEGSGVTSELPNISSADRLWRGCFKKWFVAMVASWMKDEVVNHTVLVLVGRQGIFKTTWLEHLIPPHLRAYACKLANSNDLNKDERLRIAEFGLISLDEIDSMNNRELNQLKSVITATDVNERAAYAYTKERRVRLASFCASGNRRDFLTDITGNRRWLPFEVESIQNPFYTILPYERMYAQAWALAQDPLFSYWFDLEEIEVLEQHNQYFRDESNEEQLLDVYFAVPAEGASNTKFLTTAEISERLIYYGNIKRPLSLSRLGVLLSQKGFLSIRKGSPQRRGWVVYERDNEEINAERRILSKT